MSNISLHQQVNSPRTSWYTHIEAWEQSGKTQGVYCKEHHLSIGCFGYWRTQYLEEQRRSQKLATNKTVSTLAPCKNSAPGFVAIEPLSQKLSPAVVATVQTKLGDLTLALPLAMPVMDMAQLLRALGGRHAD
jgi:hypothetical protein